MTRISSAFIRVSIAALVGGAALLWGGQTPMHSTAFVSSAEARIGRPLTPMSYAGVARRTTRRAAAVGVGAAAVGAYAVSPGCYQVTDAYGRIVTRCR